VSPAEPQPKIETQRAIVREALWIWAVAFAGLVAAKLIGLAVPLVAANISAVAAFLFLYLPQRVVRARGEEIDDYAFPPWPWTSREAARTFRRDLAWGLGVSAVMVPAVTLGFFGFLWLLQHLPLELAELLAPYRDASAPAPAFRLRNDFALQVPFQFLVVALPEEFFYRGYLQTRLTHAWGDGRLRVLGVGIGKAFLWTQVLFALGHLAQFHFWRLGVFFPALLFGWLRGRTGSIVPGVIVHAVSNLLLMTLEVSAFGP
jgi:membrane protease YdiL (CAAX protease family)